MLASISIGTFVSQQGAHTIAGLPSLALEGDAAHVLVLSHPAAEYQGLPCDVLKASSTTRDPLLHKPLIVNRRDGQHHLKPSLLKPIWLAKFLNHSTQ
jgi:hypothetical protein